MDEIGLFHPSFIHPENGYRYYSYYQSAILETILLLRELDVPIEEIQAFMKNRSAASMKQLLREKMDDLDRNMAIPLDCTVTVRIMIAHIPGKNKGKRRIMMENQNTYDKPVTLRNILKFAVRLFRSNHIEGKIVHQQDRDRKDKIAAEVGSVFLYHG